jgi:hypothetical protein
MRNELDGQVDFEGVDDAFDDGGLVWCCRLRTGRRRIASCRRRWRAGFWLRLRERSSHSVDLPIFAHADLGKAASRMIRQPDAIQ